MKIFFFSQEGSLDRSAILLLSDFPPMHPVMGEAALKLGLCSSARGSQPGSPAQLPAGKRELNKY